MAADVGLDDFREITLHNFDKCLPVVLSPLPVK